jgi:FAD/FMN-containing dehydrogenase/Fe-S oxidoreductase
MVRAASLDVGPDRVREFGDALAASGFTGDFEAGIGAREVASTDNSIYQVRPDAIVYPRCGEDVNRVVRAANQKVPRPIALTARGGNTGTNGQSLNGGVIVDFARHMNRILSLDLEARQVVVEPGVVLDQLNDALEQQGLFFPPMVSTASRATIGGMVATDASGKGSRHYGKTSDYIEAIDLVLSDGSDWRAEPMTRDQAMTIAAGEGLNADIHREVLRVVTGRGEAIAATFPKMNRGLTGYNLQKVYDECSDRFFLGPLLAGSEGTLAVSKAITLRVKPKPPCKALAVVRYASFEAGLRDVQRLLEADPLAIEILDDKVLGVAQTDIVWKGIEAILGDAADQPIAAMNFIELADEHEAGLGERIALLTELLDSASAGLVDWNVVRDPAVIAQLWALREKSVGLLARLGGGRQGAPFVEDTAVPPERLADYVAEFRDLLDRHGLSYGMFGHADVGCLHVRPFLDMKDPAQAALIRPISDSVAALTKRYGGLLWGEHGRGFRGEYSPTFFGPELYPELERIKRAFDPNNLFNPGKLAAPLDGSGLDRIDAVPLRGEHDRRIAAAYLAEFERAVACNGNGACFSWDALDVMCPSYKATRDRSQSPKGRAALLRAWTRLASNPDPVTREEREERDEIEGALAASLSTCLACKACTTLCPVKVDIPAMKSRFMAHYFATRRRPASHYLLGIMEAALAVARRIPALANIIVGSAPSRWVQRCALGLVDIPAFSVGRGLPQIATLKAIADLSARDRARVVVLIEDSFTASFDGRVTEAAATVLHHAGHLVFRLSAKPNGKILHVLGLRERFAKIARARAAECKAFAAMGVKLVGLDAATALMHEQEYAEFEPTTARVLGLEEVLAEDVQAGRLDAMGIDPREYRLFAHCTEQALRPEAAMTWQSVFEGLGITVRRTKAGCCGMAGLFGHEEKNLVLSRRLFDLSWRKSIGSDEEMVLATGFSCRCQTKRLAGFRPRHPVELLATHIKAP